MSCPCGKKEKERSFSLLFHLILFAKYLEKNSECLRDINVKFCEEVNTFINGCEIYNLYT